MQKVLLVILVILIGTGAYFLGKNQLVSNKQTQTVYSSPTPNSNADWKTYSENLDWFKKSISVKYPPNWTVAKSTHSGHPNWITVNAPIQNQCINISVSSEGKDTTLGDELKNAASQWSSEPDNNVISSNLLTINGQPAEMRYVSREGINFMDAAVYIGTDPRTFLGDVSSNTNKVFVILSSCGIAEKDIFNVVLMSVSTQ